MSKFPNILLGAVGIPGSPIWVVRRQEKTPWYLPPCSCVGLSATGITSCILGFTGTPIPEVTLTTGYNVCLHCDDLGENCFTQGGAMGGGTYSSFSLWDPAIGDSGACVVSDGPNRLAVEARALDGKCGNTCGDNYCDVSYGWNFLPGTLDARYFYVLANGSRWYDTPSPGAAMYQRLKTDGFLGEYSRVSNPVSDFLLVSIPSEPDSHGCTPPTDVYFPSTITLS